MPNFLISRYRIYYQTITPITLPDYAGSALRGAFGHALKNIACFTAARHQGVCMCAASQCIYRQLFDPEKKKLVNQREQDIAPPLMVEPRPHPAQLEAGQQSYFDLVLIGHFAHSQLAIIQLAWQRALHDGIGLKQENGQRGRATLIHMEIVSQPEPAPRNPGNLQLDLLSPLRLAERGKLIQPDTLDASVLFKALIRRIGVLAELYGQPLTLDYLELNRHIAQLKMEKQLGWMDWFRYSNRQKQDMPLGGLVGSVKLHAVSDELWQLIYIGQWLHVGKNSVFGLGNYQVTPIKSPSV